MSSIIVLDSSEDEAEPAVKKSPKPLPPVPSPTASSLSSAHTKSPTPPESSEVIIPDAVSPVPENETKRKSDDMTEKVRKRIKPTLITTTIDRTKYDSASPAISFGQDDETVSTVENEEDSVESAKPKEPDEIEKNNEQIHEEHDTADVAEDNETSATDGIEENPLTPTFTALLEACKKADPSSDMTTLIEKKLLKYYHSVHPDFVTSKGFCKNVKTICDQIQTNPELVYYQLKIIVEELKVRRKTKSAVMSNEEVASTGNERRDRQIRLLSRGLLGLTKRITKLEETDVDLGDEDNSAYLQLERLKKHACKIYDKICDLTGESKHAHRAVKKPINFQGTCYPQFNKTLQAFVNRTHTFPDFFDVLRCLEHCNIQYGFGLRNDDMKKIAQDAFLKIGKVLQNRRKADLYETVSHFTGTIPDPALEDESLTGKLIENQKFHAKIGSIIDRYAKEQELAASENKAKDKTKIVNCEEHNEQHEDKAEETDSHVTSNGKSNSNCDNDVENKSNPATPKDSTSDKENDSGADIKSEVKSPPPGSNRVSVEEIVISDEEES